MLHRVPPPQQPITMMVVADAHGDCTISDNCFAAAETDNGGSLTSFELCHGYPSVGDADRDHPRVCMHAGDGVYLRGTTRSSTGWHVYSCIFDGANSELRVDGVLEASGDAGSNPLSGLIIGRHRDLQKLAVDRFPRRVPRLQPPPRDAPARGARGQPRPPLRPAAPRPSAGRRGGRAPDGEAPAARRVKSEAAPSRSCVRETLRRLRTDCEYCAAFT